MNWTLTLIDIDMDKDLFFFGIRDFTKAFSFTDLALILAVKKKLHALRKR